MHLPELLRLGVSVALLYQFQTRKVRRISILLF